MKTCSKCKVEKPFEAFGKSKNRPDGLNPSCRECNNRREKELKSNPMMQLERQVRSSIILENKLLKKDGKKLCQRCKNIFLIDDLIHKKRCEKCQKEYKKEYREKNKEREKIWHKNYIERNKEKYEEARREKNKKHWAENKEKIKERLKKYYEDNPDKYKEKKKEQNKRRMERKKLEKENKIDPKEISALMEKLNNIKE